MKNIIIISFIAFVTLSWNNGKIGKREIELDNKVGTIKIDLANQFDTYYHSFKGSDCGCCCEEIWYSYTNSDHDNYPYNDSIAYFIKLNTDSLERYSLTISHPACNNCFKKGPHEQNVYVDFYRNRMNTYVKEHFDKQFIDTDIVKINNRSFSIWSYRRQEYSGKLSEVLEAYTIVSNEPITFQFTRIGHDSTNFIELSKSILSTVEIEEK